MAGQIWPPALGFETNVLEDGLRKQTQSLSESVIKLHYLESERKSTISTDVDRAAEQGSSLDGSADDAEEVRRGVLQLKHLRHASGEVLKAL